MAAPSSSSGATVEPSTGTPMVSSTGATGGVASTGGGTTGEASDDGMTSISPPSIDFGTIPDAPPVDTQCTMVDFLFVIDNSGSMSTHQANLIANFPTFIDGIQDTLEDVDTYQVGVVTTDTYFSNVPGCQTLSSLVVQSQSGGCGPYADGDNFMTESDDLATTFSCAANVGTNGSGIELTMQAAVEAVQRVDGGPGECNEGYLRDDSLLVVVIITDEYDGPGDPDGGTSLGDPTTWYDDIVAARGDIAENVVVLALTNYAGGACPPGSLTNDGVNIVTFANMFGANGFLGGICEPDYGPIFSEAIGVIANACENYIDPRG